VIGKVFWVGALAEMGDRHPREVEHALHELARKELVRPARTSSMENEAEYTFWHLLVRDVCYAQIPRGARAARHQDGGDAAGPGLRQHPRGGLHAPGGFD
jgi:predicted ATPase